MPPARAPEDIQPASARALRVRARAYARVSAHEALACPRTRRSHPGDEAEAVAHSGQSQPRMTFAVVRRAAARGRVTLRGVRRRFGRAGSAVLPLVIFGVGGGSAVHSGAVFNAVAGPSDNTFTAGQWASGDFRSLATGPWNDAATWQRHNGTTWVSATAAPSLEAASITIRSGHIVTVMEAIAVDEVVVAGGGELRVDAAVELTIADGPGSDVTVSGTLDADGP